MSSQADVKAIIDSIAQKDLAHAIGVYAYLRYVIPSAIISTLRAAFGDDVAWRIKSEIDEAFKVVRLEFTDRGPLSDYVYAKYIRPRIGEESRRRLAGASEEDRKVLAAASALILAALEGKRLQPYFIHVSGNEGGVIDITLVDIDWLYRATLAVVQSEAPDARVTFSKYLLGISYESFTASHNYYVLALFPDSLDLVKELAAELPKYAYVPDRQALTQIIKDLFKEKGKLKASVLRIVEGEATEASSSSRYDLSSLSFYFNFIKYFYEMLTIDKVCEEAYIKGVLWRCYPNPLIYEDLHEVFNAVYGDELERFKSKVLEALEALGSAEVACEGRTCVLEGPGVRPAAIYVDPLASEPYFAVSKKVPANAVKVVVEGVVPRDPDLLATLVQSNPELRDALWAFLDEEAGTLHVLGPTYRPDVHADVLKALAASFRVDFLGPASKEALQAVQQAKATVQQAQALTTAAPAAAIQQPAMSAQSLPAQAPAAIVTAQPPVAPPAVQAALAQPRFAACSPERLEMLKAKFEERSGKIIDILEIVAAAALEDLGFNVQVDLKLSAKDGGDVEADVWASKNIANVGTYLVYVSCKNLSDPVNSDVVENEIGRIERLATVPHAKVLVVSYMSGAARQAAARSGFLVVELGEKVTEDNAARACERVREQLGRVFAGAPPAPQDLAARIYGLAEELKKLADELSRLPQAPR